MAAPHLFRVCRFSYKDLPRVENSNEKSPSPSLEKAHATTFNCKFAVYKGTLHRPTSSKPTSNMRPPIRNQNLHLINQTGNSTLFPPILLSPPLPNPPSHSSILKPSRRQPSQNPVLPTPMQNASSTNPRISSAVARVDLIVRVRVVADANAGVQPDAFLC
jgi:hypothetical protein